MPGTADYVEGIINFLGEIVPVISASKFFRQDKPAKGLEKKMLILQKDEERIGFLVDGKIDFVEEDKDMKDIEKVDIALLFER